MAREYCTECLILTEISPEDLRAIAGLIFRTWPKPEKDAAYRSRQLREMAESYKGPPLHAPRVCVVRDAGQIVASAAIEARTVGTIVGDMTLAGLGKVCTDPDRRGEGLGERVVRAAFEPVDQLVFPFSLFQTTLKVQSFYEKIGSCVVTNPVINSTHPDGDVHPFEDEVVMRYPSGPGWPEGTIDLRGPGY